MREYDRNKRILPWTDNDREKEKEKTQILLQAQAQKDEEYDLSKKMDQLLKYAKVVSVRDIQKKEAKKIDAEYKKKRGKIRFNDGT